MVDGFYAYLRIVVIKDLQSRQWRLVRSLREADGSERKRKIK